MGTPNYISPEQARGDAHVDIRSDLYSLGATLYHMVTGVPPFDGPNPTVIMVKHLNEPPMPPRVRRPEIDSRLQPIIIKMLAKNPADRYQTPSELVDQLDDLRTRRQAEASGDPPPPPQQVRPRVVRRRR